MNITAAVLASLLLAQVQAQVPVTENIDVSIVSLDVNVTDREGNHVRGLTADDLEVLHDGKVQPLTHFAEFTPESREPQKRNVAVFFDDIHQTTRGADRKRLFSDLKTFFRQNIRPGDGVAIVEWRDRMHVTQPYTDDIAAIERALDEIASRRPGAQVDEWTALAVTERAKMWARIKAGDSAAQNGVSISSESMSLVERDLARMRSKAAGLRGILGTLAARDGRRALLFLAHRFSPGSEFMFSPVERSMGYDKTAGGVRMSVVRAAHAANATIYGFLPEGAARDETATSADDFTARHAGRRRSSRIAYAASKGALGHLAHATGGAIATSVAEISRVLPEVSEDLGSYYSIAFRANADSTAAERLEVRTKRPELTVRARNEYVVETDEEKMERAIAASLFDPPGVRGDLPWRFHVSQPRASRGKRTYPFRLEIPVRALTALPQGATHNGAFVVYVTAGGEMSRSRKTFEIPEADFARVRGGVFTYDLEIETRDEETKIAIAIVDDVARRHGIIRLDLPLDVR
jgi:VWFA-related protein